MSARTARAIYSALIVFGVLLATAEARIAGAQQLQPRNPASDGVQPGAIRQSVGGAAANPNSAPQAQTIQQRPAPQNVVPAAAGIQPPPAQPQQLPPPFTLDPQQQAGLDALLTNWEKKNDSIKLFTCTYHRWEYDPAFIADPKQAKVEADGEVKYAAPDKGLFHDLEIWEYTQDAKGQIQKTKAEQGLYWTCDGNSVYEVKVQPEKVIIEKPLPPALRGKAIANGPLPFVFGAKADELKARYYMRITDIQNGQVVLLAYPKWQKDAGNFARMDLILDAKELLPVAIQIFNPGPNPNQQSRSVISFDHPSINNPWTKLSNLLNDFSKPNLFGYKLEVQQNLLPPPDNNPPKIAPGANGSLNQAQRPQGIQR